jgi:hypothetical protein
MEKLIESLLRIAHMVPVRSDHCSDPYRDAEELIKRDSICRASMADICGMKLWITSAKRVAFLPNWEELNFLFRPGHEAALVSHRRWFPAIVELI